MNKPVFSKPIGSHLGKTIYSTVEAEDHTYVFDRLAECDREGCPLDQLKKDELMFQPGLIYRLAS